MCTPEILQRAIEGYLEDEQHLFGSLDITSETWYKKGVENNDSTEVPLEPNHSTCIKEIQMSNVNANTTTSSLSAAANAPGILAKTGGWIKTKYQNHKALIGFVAGVVVTASLTAGMEKYNAMASAEAVEPGGSESV